MLFGVIALGLVVVGVVVVRSLRTTTTEIDASEAVERLEEVLEDDAVDAPTTTAEVTTTVVNEAAEEAEVEVVEDDGEAVGSLLLTREWSDWRDGWFWWIQSVYLEPRARGKGHYGRLYAHVVEEARADPDVRGVRLYVETENEHARRVYTALGMPETSYRLHELDFDA